MLTLEGLHQLLAKLRDLSVMFSPWLNHSSDIQQVTNQSERLLHSRRSTSFRLSTSVTSAVSELECTKPSKRKSKHKRSKSKRHTIEAPDSASERVTKCKSQPTNGPPEVESNPGQVECSSRKRGSCRVINLKIPLPDDASFLLSRHYYHNPHKDYPRSRGESTKNQEEPCHNGKRARRKGVAGRNSEANEPQPTLSECTVHT